MYLGTLVIEPPDSHDFPVELGHECILDLVEAFARLNEKQMRYVSMPMLADSGIVYKDDVEAYFASVCDGESCGDEQLVDKWQDAVTMLKTKTGNCKDLVAYRLAELRLQGNQSARPGIVAGRDPKTGRTILHVVILHDDGRIEDPSAEHGMQTPW